MIIISLEDKSSIVQFCGCVEYPKRRIIIIIVCVCVCVDISTTRARVYGKKILIILSGPLKRWCVVSRKQFTFFFSLKTFCFSFFPPRSILMYLYLLKDENNIIIIIIQLSAYYHFAARQLCLFLYIVVAVVARFTTIAILTFQVADVERLFFVFRRTISKNNYRPLI